MKQNLLIIFAFVFVIMLLIGLNAASYVQKEKVPDREDFPNRSTYNTGATGTRALYDLLAETDRKVVRWREPFPAAGKFDANQFSTFVVIGSVRRDFEAKELRNILDWVSAGGRLVVIDRDPPETFLSTTANWSVSITLSENPVFGVDPANQRQMVSETSAIKPIQPSVFTSNINAVQPSKFASSIKIKRLLNEEEDYFEDTSEESAEIEETETPTDSETNSNDVAGVGFGTGESSNAEDETEATPPPVVSTESTDSKVEEERPYVNSLTAPVVQIADETTNLLVNYQFDAGEIILLSDPYIVSNAGIRLVDNSSLAVNILDANFGTIAFDEYHQGYGSNENHLFQYFAGTPVIPIFLQIFLLTGLIFYSQSRRFARALPLVEPNRLSKLEYVSAMAQLQGRTKAYDLALENIYKDFRRRVSHLVGIDSHAAKREDIAEKIAERTNYQIKDIADLLFQCEDIMHGEPTNKREIVRLIGRLREVEKALGLRRSKGRKA